MYEFTPTDDAAHPLDLSTSDLIMAEPLLSLSPEKVNFVTTQDDIDIDIDMTWHDPPSSPFVSHVEIEDQENVAPADTVAPTPLKAGLNLEENVPQSAFKISSPSKKFGLHDRTSPLKRSPTKQLMEDTEDITFRSSVEKEESPKKSSPVEQIATERPESVMSNRSRKHASPSELSRPGLVEPVGRLSDALNGLTLGNDPSTEHRPASSLQDSSLRENEGLTIAMKILQETQSETHESSSSTTYQTQQEWVESEDIGALDESEFNPDGPDLTSMTFDDTCFSTFSEMPNLDMTKFATLKKSPTKQGLFDQSTPRARAQMTPSTVRRNERTPSPTPRRGRKDNDTTNLLLDFTAQIEAFSASRRGSPTRSTRQSPVKSSTESNLLSYIQNQRSPAKPSSGVPATPGGQNRQLLNLLDFELPPPPTPRSVPTVTIRELESLKSTLQSQISSLTASLSGKEAEVASLGKAVSDAERRVGEAQEQVRDERSAREHAEAQMADWKKKGEEVQRLLQDVQSELARNDTERESLLARLAEAEKRAEEAEQRTSELETKVIEAESKNVDMTTFINPDESEENRKIYSEGECQAAIAEKVNEVAKDLHAAYKAKHEKKIKALKENYQKKADERCKELRVQIIRLERQVEEAEKKRDDTFSKVLPVELSETDATCEKCGRTDKTASPSSTSNADDLKRLEEQKSEIESLKAKLAGLQTELKSLRKSSDEMMKELEAERVEKGELVAAAEQMLALCGEKMEEMQQEDLRRSQLGGAPPTAPTPSQTQARPGSALGRPASAMSDRLGALGAEKASGIAKPSGLRAPGGFGFQGGPPLNRSTSGGKSRLLTNLERMGAGRGGE